MSLHGMTALPHIVGAGPFLRPLKLSPLCSPAAMRIKAPERLT